MIEQFFPPEKVCAVLRVEGDDLARMADHDSIWRSGRPDVFQKVAGDRLPERRELIARRRRRSRRVARRSPVAPVPRTAAERGFSGVGHCIRGRPGSSGPAGSRRRGQDKPETFDLGMTHLCDQSGKGRFRVGRKPSRKRVNRTLRRIRERLREKRHDSRHGTAAWLGRVMNGCLNP